MIRHRIGGGVGSRLQDIDFVFLKVLRVLLILFFIPGLPSCAGDQKQWFRGNLHTHSYWSDGDEFPEMIMDWYKSHGYQFVALSDHNILAEGGNGIDIGRDPIKLLI